MIFLQEVAKKIIDFGLDKKICVVCPNKRTVDYLRYYISQQLQRTIWSPKFMTLSELMQELSGLERVDNLLLLVELYRIFVERANNVESFKNMDFDNFVSIGEIILNDFNELDNYLVDVSLMFTHISDYEQIDYIDEVLTDKQKQAIEEFFGHFRDEKMTDEKQYFIDLWNIIPDIYQKLRQILLDKKQGYNGLISRSLYEKLQAEDVDVSVFDKYFFVGFNAITKVQTLILKELKDRGLAKFFWDYDKFYVENTENEAGFFIRQNIAELGDDLDIERNNFLSEKNVNLIGFPLQVAQAKAIPTLLKNMNIDLQNRSEASKTAIVMPDETMLFPVLHSLPQEVEKVNVTVGYPFSQTAVYSFFSAWLTLVRKFSLTKKIPKDELSVLLKNSLFEELIAADRKKIVEALSAKVFVSSKDLLSIDSGLMRLLFADEIFVSTNTLLNKLLELSENLFPQLKQKRRDVELEALYQFYNLVLNLKSLYENNEENLLQIIDIKTFIAFLFKSLIKLHIPFAGKSLKSLQVMTLMETRNLDFENLIILNLNENILPRKPHRNSLISEFMRKSFGMPLLAYQDAIYAYLFYRLLQNAKNITLTYSNLVSDKSSELSRFVQQIAAETNLLPKQRQLSYSEIISLQQAQSISISNDEDVRDIILQKFDNDKQYLSASALITYISCPLKYYFKYIVHLPAEEAEENFEIDAVRFGTIFHRTMEELYKPLINKDLSKQDIDQMRKRAKKVLKEVMLGEFQGIEEALNTGINSILDGILLKYVHRTLDYDEGRLPFKVLGTEQKSYGKIFFENNGKRHFVKIYGVLDRVDEKDGKVYIIDYKTGSENLYFSEIEDIFSDKIVTKKLKAMFQLSLYTMLIAKNFLGKEIVPNVYLINSISKMYEANLRYNKDTVTSLNKEYFEQFRQNLEQLLIKIYDISGGFEQSENLFACTYCDYKKICNR